MLWVLGDPPPSKEPSPVTYTSLAWNLSSELFFPCNPVPSASVPLSIFPASPDAPSGSWLRTNLRAGRPSPLLGGAPRTKLCTQPLRFGRRAPMLPQADPEMEHCSSARRPSPGSPSGTVPAADKNLLPRALAVLVQVPAAGKNPLPHAPLLPQPLRRCQRAGKESPAP